MTTSYIPTRDADALLWMQTFSNGINSNFATYELTAADALAISDAVDAFALALPIAEDPATRTPVNINLKDNARNAAEQICRQYVQLIKYNAGISDAAKIAIGVRPVNNSRDPIFAPTTSPLLNVIAATPGAHTLRFADSKTPDSAKKPFGAANLQLFIAVADAPIADADDAMFHGIYTKNPVGVLFAQEDDGKMATYFGRWAGRRGDVSPWSVPVSLRIAA